MTFYCSYYFAPSYMCHQYHLPTTTILNNPGGLDCLSSTTGGGPSWGHWGSGVLLLFVLLGGYFICSRSYINMGPD